MWTRSGCALLVAVGMGCGSAWATNITGNVNVDNQFTAYLSTDDSLAGTPIGSGTDWPTTYSIGPAALTPGTTQFLHILATDTGAPAMFIGRFDLSDTGFEFVNGSQTLLTGDSIWQVSKTGFGSNYAAPTDEGPEGTGPWGSFAAIDNNARFIWADTQGNTVYFSAAIRPLESVVPEPATLSLLALGGAGLMLRRRASR